MLYLKVTTSRFFLKPITLKEINQNYLSWFTEKTNSKFILTFNNQKKLKDLKNYYLNKKNKKIIFLAIFTKKLKKHIGNLKFEPVDLKNKAATLGIFIGNPEWRNKGCGYEVTKKTLNEIKKKFNINTFYLGVDKKNLSALKLYQKLNFKVYKKIDKSLLMKAII